MPLLCFDLVPTILGTPGDDTIQGTAGNDVIVGLGGADTINGLDGDDVICAGDNTLKAHDASPNAAIEGFDVVHGGNGNDRIDGQGGVDKLYGDAGDDLLLGGTNVSDPAADSKVTAPAEFLHGGLGNDTLRGGSGANSSGGSYGNDTLLGGADHDLLYGRQGDDKMAGGPGDDVIRGYSGTDEGTGNKGNDDLRDKVTSLDADTLLRRLRRRPDQGPRRERQACRRSRLGPDPRRRGRRHLLEPVEPARCHQLLRHLLRGAAGVGDHAGRSASSWTGQTAMARRRSSQASTSCIRTSVPCASSSPCSIASTSSALEAPV